MLTYLIKVEQENDQLKRKGMALEMLAQLESMRKKYNETVENYEKELQKVMRENLVQRRKLMGEVEEKFLEVSAHNSWLLFSL